jgi:hypothetical protein
METSGIGFSLFLKMNVGSFSMKARALILAAATVALVSCKSSDKRAVDSEPRETWTSTMQSMSESLAKLTQLSLDPVAFNASDNQKIMDVELSRLSRFSHDVAAMKKRPSDDPAMEQVARHFSSDMQEARRQLQIGNRAYARHMIRNATDYCISCHTQTNLGPQFDFSNTQSLSRLGSLDQANFLFAVRRFDEGLNQFQQAMHSPDVALRPYPSLENVTMRALAVAVRVKQDPKLADSILNYIIESKWAPVYLQISAVKWRGSVSEWRKLNAKPSSLIDAKSLVSRAWRKQMESPLARAGLIEQLRASALLHDLLAHRKPGVAYAETLYYAALTSEALRELDVYSAPENYYESCIRHLPRSKVAANCYLRLEGITMANYSQYDSSPLPADIRQHLDELKKLAVPQERSWKDWGHDHDR